uniref:EGF-like domain-containing protein n=1 Tax=Timema tahoe TaxID=61484 RepID=A0A7R9IQ85_9NEOP|nr:unnamed protein product [Timema tahoe]
MNMGCQFETFSFGLPWDKAYLECCVEEDQFVSPIAGNATRKPPTPVIDNLCNFLEGELCAHICVPTPGSYRCECHEGFSLMSDGKSCQQKDLPDRCKLNNPCSHKCLDTGIAIECSCYPGYELGQDERSCLGEYIPILSYLARPVAAYSKGPLAYCLGRYQLSAAGQISLPLPTLPTTTHHPGPGPLTHTDTTNTTKFSKI